MISITADRFLKQLTSSPLNLGFKLEIYVQTKYENKYGCYLWGYLYNLFLLCSISWMTKLTIIWGYLRGIFHTTSFELQIDLYQNYVNVIRYSIVATIIRMPILGILLYDAFVLIIVIFIFLSGINIKNFTNRSIWSRILSSILKPFPSRFWF